MQQVSAGALQELLKDDGQLPERPASAAGKSPTEVARDMAGAAVRGVWRAARLTFTGAPSSSD